MVTRIVQGKTKHRRCHYPRCRHWCAIFYRHASWSRPLSWVFSSLIYYHPSEEPNEPRHINVLTATAAARAAIVVVLVSPFGVLRSNWHRLVIAMVMVMVVTSTIPKETDVNVLVCVLWCLRHELQNERNETNSRKDIVSCIHINIYFIFKFPNYIHSIH